MIQKINKYIIKQCIITSKNVATTCTYLDEEDQVQVIQNTFFNLCCFNEYVRDLYESNKLRHFELILEEHGFNMSSDCVKEEAKLEVDLDEINDALF